MKRAPANMKWCKPISLTHPLQDARLVSFVAPTGEPPERQLEQAAYERGRRDAEKAFGAQLVQQRTELDELQKGVLESLRRVVPQLTRETESALIELALESARKVVAGAPITVRTVEAVVREAVAQVEDSAEITIHLNPEDFALLRKSKSPVLEGLPESGPLRFAGSAEVSRGGCLVQTRFGLLDARRETKFEQLRESLAV